MKPGNDDQQRAHQSWVRSLYEARAKCRQAKNNASVDVSDPKRAIWPAVSRENMTREHKTVAQFHAMVLDYAEHVRPFKNRCAGHWTEEIASPHRFPDGSTLPVVLSEIETWADRRYREPDGTTHELTGRTRTYTIRRVHLPTKYARMAMGQLDKCLEQLKLSADPPTPERTVDGPSDAW